MPVVGPFLSARTRSSSRRTAAMVDAIPASHSIGVEAREKLGGRTVLDYLVREGEQLPKKGIKVFKAEESLKSGSPGAIKFKLWEGDIADPITDNRFIGMFQIRGSDFTDGVIAAGEELTCKYEVLELWQYRPRSVGAFDWWFVPQRAQLLFKARGTNRLHQGIQAY